MTVFNYVWDAFLAVALALFVLLFSRVGLAMRLKSLEKNVEELRAWREQHEIEVMVRVHQLTLEFRAEVKSALAPIAAQLNSQDQVLAQMRTMLSAVINGGAHEVDDSPVEGRVWSHKDGTEHQGP